MEYSNRSTDTLTAATVQQVVGYGGVLRVEIISTDNDGIRVPVNDLTSVIESGDELILETTNATIITGLAFANDPERWLFRKTDGEILYDFLRERDAIRARYKGTLYGDLLRDGVSVMPY